MTTQPQTADNIDINLTLKLNVIQTIAAALDEIPRKFAQPILEEISKQVNPQIEAHQAAQQPASVTMPGPSA